MSDDQKTPDERTHRPRLAARLAVRRKRIAMRQVARNVALKRAASIAGAKKTGDLAKRETRAELVARRKSFPVAETASTTPTTFTPQPWPTMVRPLQVLMDTRRARRRGFFLRLALFCGLPTFLTLFYLLVIASPRYISEFEFTYQAYQPQTSLASGLVQTVLGTSQGSTVDLSTILYEYLRSEAALTRIDKEVNLREYYSNPKVDYFSRMSRDADITTFLRFFHSYVSVSEGQGGYLTIDVTAFDPNYALAVSKAVVRAADDMIDDMTARARQDEVRFAEDEVKRAETRMLNGRLALTQFQNLHGDLNPQGTADQLGGIVGQIEGQLSAQRAALTALQSVGPNSPQVAAINAKISALEDQLRSQQKRLAAPAGGSTYSELLNTYSSLQVEQEFAKDAYTSAQQGLAVARADAARKQNYLVDFAPPYSPDRAGVMYILEDTLTVLVLTLILFGIGSLVVGAMRDQTGL